MPLEFQGYNVPANEQFILTNNGHSGEGDTSEMCGGAISELQSAREGASVREEQRGTLGGGPNHSLQGVLEALGSGCAARAAPLRSISLGMGEGTILSPLACWLCCRSGFLGIMNASSHTVHVGARPSFGVKPTWI